MHYSPFFSIKADNASRLLIRNLSHLHLQFPKKYRKFGLVTIQSPNNMPRESVFLSMRPDTLAEIAIIYELT